MQLSLFNHIFLIVDLTNFYANAQLWIWSFIEHFCIERSNFFDECGLKAKL